MSTGTEKDYADARRVEKTHLMEWSGRSMKEVDERECRSQINPPMGGDGLMLSQRNLTSCGWRPLDGGNPELRERMADVEIQGPNQLVSRTHGVAEQFLPSHERSICGEEYGRQPR